MIDDRSLEELLSTDQTKPAPAVGATMPCGAIVTNVYDAYEAGKKAGESLPKAPEQAYRTAQNASKDLIDAISWYVWQNVFRQFKGELEDIRDLLKKLDDEKDFNSAVDERIINWATNHLNEAMERADVVGLVINEPEFDNAVEGLIKYKVDDDRLETLVADKLEEKLEEKLGDAFDEKFDEKLEEYVEDWKFTEAVKEAVKELHFSVDVS